MLAIHFASEAQMKTMEINKILYCLFFILYDSHGLIKMTVFSTQRYMGKTSVDYVNAALKQINKKIQLSLFFPPF